MSVKQGVDYGSSLSALRSWENSGFNAAKDTLCRQMGMAISTFKSAPVILACSGDLAWLRCWVRAFSHYKVFCTPIQVVALGIKLVTPA